MVLDRSPYPEGFPAQRHAGYVPESSLLAVEWFLPTFDIIPAHKAFRHVKTRKTIEPTARPPADAQRLYKAVIAQIAVRTVREVFTATPDDMVSTVVFNGHVDTVDPATGRRIQPPLISMRATREKFDELVLAEPRFDPVASIKRHFFAAISPHPEELKEVEPVMPFSRADPRVIEAIDVISTLDQRPNLLDLTPKEFESFIQNLFTKMGYETDQFRSSGDGGIDCMAYKRDPVAPMKIAVQAKLYTKTVQPTHVRDLYGTMQHEGATLGIMITTSGYGPGSEEFANGKPLHLIDGTGLMSICQEHGIPARILGLGSASTCRELAPASRRITGAISGTGALSNLTVSYSSSGGSIALRLLCRPETRTRRSLYPVDRGTDCAIPDRQVFWSEVSAVGPAWCISAAMDGLSRWRSRLPGGRAGARRAGVSALALFAGTAALAVLVAVLFHLAWPPWWWRSWRMPALYLAWLAVPGVSSPEPAAAEKPAHGRPARDVESGGAGRAPGDRRRADAAVCPPAA